MSYPARHRGGVRTTREIRVLSVLNSKGAVDVGAVVGAVVIIGVLLLKRL